MWAPLGRLLAFVLRRRNQIEDGTNEFAADTRGSGVSLPPWHSAKTAKMNFFHQNSMKNVKKIILAVLARWQGEVTPQSPVWQRFRLFSWWFKVNKTKRLNITYIIKGILYRLGRIWTIVLAARISKILVLALVSQAFAYPYFCEDLRCMDFLVLLSYKSLFFTFFMARNCHGYTWSLIMYVHREHTSCLFKMSLVSKQCQRQESGLKKI